MTRWMYPPGQVLQRADGFDPVVEWARHGVQREVAETLWEQICAETGVALQDRALAERRFGELAARLASGGAEPGVGVGKLTRVSLESDPRARALRPSAGSSPRVPGRRALVAAELGAEAWPRLRFADHRAIGLRELHDGLGADHPLRPELLAAAVALLNHKWSFWQGIAKTFGYNQDTDREDCLSPKEFIDKVVDGVARNGNFDINVGPTAAGLIPDYEQYPLLQLGEWLRVNGEGIYGTRHWSVQTEGDARFTAKGDFVYAIFLKWQGDEFKLNSVKPVPGSKITMLGASGDLEWTYDEASGLTVKYPRHKARPTACSYAWTFKIKVN